MFATQYNALKSERPELESRFSQLSSEFTNLAAQQDRAIEEFCIESGILVRDKKGHVTKDLRSVYNAFILLLL